jgi:exodeoxyribonuclease VII large subunit
LSAAARRAVADVQGRLEALAARLESVSPKRVLERGYAIISDTNGLPVTSTALAAAGAHLNVEFNDGKVGVQVLDGPAKPARARATPPKGNEKQGSLL